MQLKTTIHDFDFKAVQLHFHDLVEVDIFAKKNNKTVAETVQQPRYSHLADTVHRGYANALDQPLGAFLHNLKTQNDAFYLRFLNKYGDSTFCSFSIKDTDVIKQRGLYVYAVDNNVQYIGKSNDTFGKRISQGYGRIHPKNCYIDGQATNCHLNALIAKHRPSITFYILSLTDPTVIGELERHFIQAKQPQWNIALKASPKELRI